MIHTAKLDKLPLQTERDSEVAARTFQALGSRASIAAWADKHSVTYEIGDRRFTMLVDAPQGGESSSAVIVGGEFANGLHFPGGAGAVLRARIVRDIVDPNAALIMQPNSTLRETNHNFSRAERARLRRGDTSPLTDRVAVTLNDFPHVQTMTAFGPSQAAYSLGALTSRRDMPQSAFLPVEAPNTRERHPVQLAVAYGSSGKQLKSNIAANFSRETGLKSDMQKTITLGAFTVYGLGIARPENLALLSGMSAPSLTEAISATLERGGSVLQAWGTIDDISGDQANTEIANIFGEEPLFEAWRFEGIHADHSLTNRYAVMGSLARRAHQLLKI